MSHADTLAVLRRAREILTPEGVWISDGYCRDASRHLCMPDSGRAKYYCLGAAIEMACLELQDDGRAEESVDEALASYLGFSEYEKVEAWELAICIDQVEVLDVLDGTIARLETEGA